MTAMAASRQPMPLRLVISIGLILARPAQTMAAPATGDMVRPSEPLSRAVEPISMIP